MRADVPQEGRGAVERHVREEQGAIVAGAAAVVVHREDVPHAIVQVELGRAAHRREARREDGGLGREHLRDGGVNHRYNQRYRRYRRHRRYIRYIRYIRYNRCTSEMAV